MASEQTLLALRSNISDGAKLVAVTMDLLGIKNPQQIATARKLPIVIVRNHIKELEAFQNKQCEVNSVTSASFYKHYVALITKKWGPHRIPPTAYDTVRAIYRNLKKDMSWEEIFAITELFIDQCRMTREADLVIMYSQRKKYVR